MDGLGAKAFRDEVSTQVQTLSGAHSASSTMGTGSLAQGKAAGTWRWPPTPSSAEVKDRV